MHAASAAEAACRAKTFRFIGVQMCIRDRVNITAGSDLTEQLTTGFAEAQGLTKKQQVDLLSGLLLSESERAEEQYVYASEMKLLGAVSAQRLDVVLMDEYARDRLLADDYFLDLRTLDASFHALSGLNAGGTVLDISDTPFVRQAGFSGKVYLGVCLLYTSAQMTFRSLVTAIWRSLSASP